MQTKNDITLIDGDKIFQEGTEVARIFSDFFSGAVKDLNISLPKEYIYEEASVLGDRIEGIISKYQHHPSMKLINDNVVKGEFSFASVCQSDIEKEIVALDEKMSSMSSSIPPKFLKENINVCSQPLTAIINNGILNLSFDGGLKLADLIPMHKMDGATNKENYRNVSLLPVVSKIYLKNLCKVRFLVTWKPTSIFVWLLQGLRVLSMHS